eukprot:11567384-Heterocapsa_arctica.AAC.1
MVQWFNPPTHRGRNLHPCGSLMVGLWLRYGWIMVPLWLGYGSLMAAQISQPRANAVPAPANVHA